MGVCLAFELLQCAGKHLDSSGSAAQNPLPQVSNEEASSSQFLPVDGPSAALISPHRLLVTGGMIQDERVLPFSVIRYLDLDPRSDQAHRWSRPTLLRPPSQRGGAAKRARRCEPPIPVCRVDHTLTMVPDNAKLYLIGGMKIGGKDGGMGCTTMFAFDSKSKTWDSVEPAKPSSRVKEEANEQFGPRFAHSATYISYTPKCSSSRQKARAKPAPHIYAYGGYSASSDHQPLSDVHVFDVKKCKWSLAIPASSTIEPPCRALHAAALSPSGKYIVIHGGLVSDLHDDNAMSLDLFLFDVQEHKWIEPELHGSSAIPPSPRKQHSLAQGVGRHQGSLVMYGGYLSNQTFTKELFLCKVLEPEHPGQRIEVLWEKVEVRTIVPRPLPDDGHDVSKNILSDRIAALSGGCMVPIPDLGKYIIVGGKTAYGVRTAPLMLDPGESDDMAFSQSVEMPEEPPGMEMANNGTAQVAPKYINAPHSPHCQREIYDDMNGNLCAPMIDDNNQQGIGRSPSPADGGFDMPRASSLQRTSSEKSPVPTAGPRGKANAGCLGSDRFRKRKPRSITTEPSPKILPAACNVVQPAPNPAEHELENDTMREANALLLRSQRIRSSNTTVNADRPCPPLKKRRLRSDTQEVGRQKEHDAQSIISPAPLVDDAVCEGHNGELHDDAVQQSMSTRSEFIAPSEIKRIGRTNTTKTNGGRGRVTVRQKQAELDASKRKIEVQEESIRRSTSEIKKLRDENDMLGEANLQFKIDNRKLNKEMQKLLQEIQSLRNIIAAQQASDTGVVSNSVPIPVQDESVPIPATSSNADNVTTTPNATMSGNVDKFKALRSKTDGLQEEYTAICSEKDSLLQELKECEEERRHVEIELNRTRNLLNRSHIECEKLRTKASDCEKAMKEAFTDRESIQTKLKNAENDIIMLKTKNETLSLHLMDEKQKLGKETSERAVREREVGELKAQLADTLKMYGASDGKYRMLMIDREDDRGKVEELNRVVNANTDEINKMKEKYAEVVAERDTLRSELNDKVREHEAAVVATEKDKASIEKLRKELCDSSIEQKRVKRELDMRSGECTKLKTKLVRLQTCCKAMWPAFTKISKQLDQIVRESEVLESNGSIPSPEVVTGEGQGEEVVVAEMEAGGVRSPEGGAHLTNRNVPNKGGEGQREARSADVAKEIPESDEAAEDEEEP